MNGAAVVAVGSALEVAAVRVGVVVGRALVPLPPLLHAPINMAAAMAAKIERCVRLVMCTSRPRHDMWRRPGDPGAQGSAGAMRR